MDPESNIGLQQPPSMQDPNQIHQGLGSQHQQSMDVRNQVMGHSDGYQISPATIAQATIAQAAVNSDQSQDLSRSKDPMTLMSRMYVGNLDPKQVTKEDLHDTFSVYGRILDIKIHNHFAFIQFDNPFSCMDAIHTAQSNTIQGQQPKLQLAADGQRARNEMIFNGNTSSLPPDPKELPPNVPYPNPFRGQSGHLPTFLTVQPTHPPPVETPVTPQPTFQPAAPAQMPVPGIQQAANRATTDHSSSRTEYPHNKFAASHTSVSAGNCAANPADHPRSYKCSDQRTAPFNRPRNGPVCSGYAPQLSAYAS